MYRFDNCDGKKTGSIAIYGAQMVAVSVYHALKATYPNYHVKAFVVRSLEGNLSSIDGIPVISLREWPLVDIPIVIAVPENFHEGIVSDLEKKGIKNWFCIDSKAEATLMERFYSLFGKFECLHLLEKGEKKASLSVYMSKFHKDLPLKGRYQLPAWIYPVQAGAALTDVRVAALRDDEGDNISAKNVNYSELSAMYWIGKHGDSDYLGLFHYRRILDVTEEDLYRIAGNDVDVILPYPTMHYPNIYEHHKRYLKESDWETMLQALRECAPDYLDKFPKIFEEKYFYNYNMFIAKKKVFRDYCNWLFPILSRVEELSTPKGCERADRYIGYLGENLTTLYFMANRKGLKIAHTGRLMLT